MGASSLALVEITPGIKASCNDLLHNISDSEHLINYLEVKAVINLFFTVCYSTANSDSCAESPRSAYISSTDLASVPLPGWETADNCGGFCSRGEGINLSHGAQVIRCRSVGSGRITMLYRSRYQGTRRGLVTTLFGWLRLYYGWCTALELDSTLLK